MRVTVTANDGDVTDLRLFIQTEGSEDSATNILLNVMLKQNKTYVLQKTALNEFEFVELYK